MTVILSTNLTFAAMKKFRYLTLIIALGLFLASCEKKEEPLPLPPKGDAASIQVDMGTDYSKEFYFNFNKGIVKQNEIGLWSLAFSTDISKPEMWVNGYRQEFVVITDVTDFAAITAANAPTYSESNKIYDSSSGLPGASALGNLLSNNRIGKLSLVRFAGKMYKVIINSVSEQGYQVSYGPIDATTAENILIPVDSNYNFVYLHFQNGIVTDVEPPKQDWDFVLTYYQFVYYTETPYLPYQVVGALLNPYHTTGAADSTETIEFDNYHLEQAEQLSFVPNRDIIGFDWKTANINTLTYTVKTKHNFFVQTQNGSLWKLHFTNFHNDKGERGSPQFAYQRLK